MQARASTENESAEALLLFERQGAFLARQENGLLNSVPLTGECHQTHSLQNEASLNGQTALLANFSHAPATSRSSAPVSSYNCSGFRVLEKERWSTAPVSTATFRYF